MKVARFAAIYFGLFLMFSAIALGLGGPGATFDAAGIIASLVLLVVITFIGTRVGYRWRDLALLSIPVVGVYFWFMWMWRLACLPDRYWEWSEDPSARIEAARTREMQADLALREHWRDAVSRERKRKIYKAIFTGRQLVDSRDAALAIWIAGKKKRSLVITAASNATLGTIVLVALWTEPTPHPSATYWYWTALALVWALFFPVLALWLRHKALKAELLNETQLALDQTSTR